MNDDAKKVYLAKLKKNFNYRVIVRAKSQVKVGAN